jgi:hypothetical protein
MTTSSKEKCEHNRRLALGRRAMSFILPWLQNCMCPLRREFEIPCQGPIPIPDPRRDQGRSRLNGRTWGFVT